MIFTCSTHHSQNCHAVKKKCQTALIVRGCIWHVFSFQALMLTVKPEKNKIKVDQCACILNYSTVDWWTKNMFVCPCLCKSSVCYSVCCISVCACMCFMVEVGNKLAHHGHTHWTQMPCQQPWDCPSFPQILFPWETVSHSPGGWNQGWNRSQSAPKSGNLHSVKHKNIQFNNPTDCQLTFET